jgi:conjugal transfer pilus assembly protein TraK
MPIADRAGAVRPCGQAAALLAFAAVMSGQAHAQSITALPDQTSSIRLSNHDVNHVVCQGGEIEDVKFSAEKGIAVERAGSDAWIKFLVKEIDTEGMATRTYPTAASEFFVSCNGAVYPLYAEPSDIPAQTIILVPGAAQRAQANADLLGPLVEEERAVSITLSMLQDRVPASFSEVAPATRDFALPALSGAFLRERRSISIDGAGLSASEYLVRATAPQRLDERAFLVSSLGANIFAVTLDRSDLRAGDTARLIVVRRGVPQ